VKENGLVPSGNLNFVGDKVNWHPYARAMAATFVVPLNVSGGGESVQIGGELARDEMTQMTQITQMTQTATAMNTQMMTMTQDDNSRTQNSHSENPKTKKTLLLISDSDHRSNLPPSPFPLLDAFVSSELATIGSKIGSKIGAIGSWSSFNNVVTYMMRENRFCSAINRQHKSNNIFFKIDLTKGVWQQSCFDVDCKNFREQQCKPSSFPLPEEIIEWTFELGMIAATKQAEQEEQTNESESGE